MHSNIIIAVHPCDCMCVQFTAIFLPQATLAVFLDRFAIDWNAKSLYTKKKILTKINIQVNLNSRLRMYFGIRINS